MTPRNAWADDGAEEGEMGIDRSHGLDAITSERLIAGETVGPEALVRLLAAAAAPPFSHETAGEDAAATAFRTARTWPVREGTPRPVAARRATLLGFKTAAAVTIAVAAAGAALAAGTGVLPNPFEPPEPAAPISSSSSTRAGSTPPLSSTTPWGSTPGASGGPPATVPVSLVGLCRAWEAQDGRDEDKATNSPSFNTLVTAAGGVEYVDEYCETLLAAEESGQPSHPAHPSQGPASAPPGVAGGQSKTDQPAGAGGR
jgi:hypothetical protein